MSKTELQDAVQPIAWYKDLPRKEWDNYPLFLVHEGWYSVYKLPNDVYAIYEAGHFQEVISYLILGTDKALLLDTGLGICPIKPLIKKLTNLEVLVVNSHSHFDHIGGNHEFDFVHIFDYKASIERLENGLETSEVIEHLRGDSVCIPYPAGFDPKNYHIKKSVPKAIQDGHIFDLGNRTLKVMHTPGHSPDSIMFLDEANDILFTGDTFYPATMYAHLSSSTGINSVFNIYKETMNKLAKTINVKSLYTCHNYPIVSGDTLIKVSDAFDLIASGKKEYIEDSNKLKKYQFDGFAIVCE